MTSSSRREFLGAVICSGTISSAGCISSLRDTTTKVHLCDVLLENRTSDTHSATLQLFEKEDLIEERSGILDPFEDTSFGAIGIAPDEIPPHAGEYWVRVDGEDIERIEYDATEVHDYDGYSHVRVICQIRVGGDISFLSSSLGEEDCESLY